MGRRNKPCTNASSAIAYLRVSTDDQALGPDAQRAAIARWASSNNVELVGEHVDLGVSGGADLADRPGLVNALAAFEATRAGILVVAKRDRLARDVVLTAAVERLARRKGARVISADGTGNVEGPEGMLMRGLVDLFAQYERALGGPPLPMATDGAEPPSANQTPPRPDANVPHPFRTPS